MDFTLRKAKGPIRGEANLFYNRFQEYIFQSFTGEVEDGLDVLQYMQGDAEFYGFEGQLNCGLVHSYPHHLDLSVMTDYVRAELTDTGEPLPRIPPFRFGVGLEYTGEHFSGGVDLRRVAEQDRISAFEEPTGGYTLLHARIGYGFFIGRLFHKLELRGRNLTDELARVHTSFLKEEVPLPGRDFSLVYRLLF